MASRSEWFLPSIFNSCEQAACISSLVFKTLIAIAIIYHHQVLDRSSFISFCRCSQFCVTCYMYIPQNLKNGSQIIDAMSKATSFYLSVFHLYLKFMQIRDNYHSTKKSLLPTTHLSDVMFKGRRQLESVLSAFWNLNSKHNEYAANVRIIYIKLAPHGNNSVNIHHNS